MACWGLNAFLPNCCRKSCLVVVAVSGRDQNKTAQLLRLYDRLQHQHSCKALTASTASVEIVLATAGDGVNIATSAAAVCQAIISFRLPASASSVVVGTSVNS
ncbi:hypothetical protein TYRP_009251 [Tyrophagus putrescentiae]|nr:hypothetical protein TYRP_009251 [Tyrophagus putrescentiae]